MAARKAPKLVPDVGIILSDRMILFVTVRVYIFILYFFVCFYFYLFVKITNLVS